MPNHSCQNMINLMQFVIVLMDNAFVGVLIAD